VDWNEAALGTSFAADLGKMGAGILSSLKLCESAAVDSVAAAVEQQIRIRSPI
jgi:hypothetical protein